jgi:putative nucleotidyltransferase with HDIG domain
MATGENELTDESRGDAEAAPLEDAAPPPVPAEGKAAAAQDAASPAPAHDDVSEVAPAEDAASEPVPRDDDSTRAEPRRPVSTADPSGGGRPLVVAPWMPDASRERLQEAADWEVTDDVGRVDEAHLVVVSTRGPRARTIPLARRLRDSKHPAAVVCHAGGESVALELIRGGGSGMVAEGHEAALVAFVVKPKEVEEPLVVAYEQRMGSQVGEVSPTASLDTLSGLPGTASYETRLSEINQAGMIPRLGFAEIVNFPRSSAGPDEEALTVLARRISGLYRDVAERAGVELFALSQSLFAFVGTELSMEDAHEFGLRLVQAARVFSPEGMALTVAVGHAGPPGAATASLLRELAERALESATGQGGGAVVSAENLPHSLVFNTELDLALRMVSYVSENDGYVGSHSSRVAQYATDLARALGFEGRDMLRIRLAALLHDVGKVGLPPEAMRMSPDLEDFALDAYRSHPERGARHARIVAGDPVAEAILTHHEQWDGGGFPRGLSGEDIPIAARIVAVANTYDELRTSLREDGVALSPADCVAKLREGSGTLFDPSVVDAAAMVLSA